jgi:hypothetical protein
MISNVLENLPYIFAFLAGLIFLQQMIASFQATIVENTEMKPAIIFSVLIDGIFILLYIYTTTPPSSSGSLFVAAAGIGQALLLLFFIAFSFVYLFFRTILLARMVMSTFKEGISKNIQRGIQIYLAVVILLLFQPLAVSQIRNYQYRAEQKRVLTEKTKIIRADARPLDELLSKTEEKYPKEVNDSELSFVKLYESAEKIANFSYDDNYFWSYRVSPLESEQMLALENTIYKKYKDFPIENNLNRTRVERLNKMIFVDEGTVGGPTGNTLLSNDYNTSNIFYELPNVIEYKKIGVYDTVLTQPFKILGFERTKPLEDKQQLVIKGFSLILAKVENGWLLVGFEKQDVSKIKNYSVVKEDFNKILRGKNEGINLLKINY